MWIKYHWTLLMPIIKKVLGNEWKENIHTHTSFVLIPRRNVDIKSNFDENDENPFVCLLWTIGIIVCSLFSVFVWNCWKRSITKWNENGGMKTDYSFALLCQLDEKIIDIRVKGYGIWDLISKYYSKSWRHMWARRSTSIAFWHHIPYSISLHANLWDSII